MKKLILILTLAAFVAGPIIANVRADSTTASAQESSKGKHHKKDKKDKKHHKKHGKK